MAQGMILYPKRKERGLVKIAGNEVNSVINQITNTTTVTSLDAVPDGVVHGKLRNTNLTLGALSTLTRELAASGYKITGLGAGTTAGNAVRYEQVLLLAGGTMSGAIAMGANKVTGLAAATVAGDAVRFEQLGGGDRTVLFSVAGTLTVGANASFEIPAPVALTISKVYINVKTAPTGATLIVDFNIGGVTIFTTQSARPVIAIGGTADESGTPAVTAWAKDAIGSIDIDQVGSTVAGANLVVQVRCEVA